MKNKKIITELLSCILVILVISLIANKANLSSKYTTSNRYFNLLDTNNNTPTINMSELMEEFNDLKESNDDLVRSVEQLTAEVSIIKNIKPGSVGALNRVYPVGSVYITTSSDLNTAAKVGQTLGGTWEAYATNRVLKGTTTTANQESGTTSVTLTANNIPSHTHTLNSHTHSFTPSGSNSIGGTANLTSNNQSANHTHRLPSTGNFTGSTNNTGGHTHNVSTVMRHTTASPDAIGGGIKEGGNWTQYKWKLRGDMYTSSAGDHTHTFSLAATNTGINSANHTHTIAKANLATAIGTITFTGKAGTTEASNAATGSAGKSSPDAFSVLDPYITVYMYKRTA